MASSLAPAVLLDEDQDMPSQDSALISTPADIPAVPLTLKTAPPDVEMHDVNNFQAPPSPAPSGDSQLATTTLRPSPSPMSTHFSAATDHPETSIPSPASPSAGAVEPEPEAEADAVDTSSPIVPDDVDVSAASLAPPTPTAAVKHSYDDGEEGADAMIDGDQRPVKRARTADVASPSPSTSFPVASSMPAIPEPSEASTSSVPKTHSTISPAQFKFAQSVLRSIRRQKDAFAFNAPVDIVALNIPHYPTIVKRPMDFSTIEKKLNASNPAAKLDAAPTHARYYSIVEFFADVKLVFDNCFLFNGPEHIVSQSAKRLQAVFDKQSKNMPPPQAPTAVYKSPTPAPAPAPVASTSKKAPAARRPSTSVPAIRRDANSDRPKREIHPPAPKDSGYDEQAAPKRASGSARVHKSGKRKKDDGTLDQLRFCAKIISDLYKKQHSAYAQFFYDPVSEDYAPNYYKVIKKPMDMSTLKRNLDQKVYPDANAFYDDFQLMISNCVRYNPVGTMVYNAGQDLVKTFNEKWRLLPPLRTPEPSDDESEDEAAGGPDANTLEHLEAQLAGLRETIDALKGSGGKGKAKASKPEPASSSRYAASRQASTSSYVAPPPKPAAPKRSAPKKSAGGKKAAANGAAGRRMLDADAQLTFEEKKELSETIQNLEGAELEEVIQIIHDGVPDIGENTDEIEIEIDALPPTVLRALWNTVIKPKQPAAAATSSKPFKSGRNQAGTGGLKRKSMDEVAEAEKMRLLEQRISMFDAVTNGAAGASTAGAQRTESVATINAGVLGGDADSTHSSDSESDSGSSSDSD